MSELMTHNPSNVGVVGCGWHTVRRAGSAPPRTPPGYVAHAVLEATPLLTAPPHGSTQDNDEVEWQGGRVFLHLGARRDDPPRG